MGKENKEHEHTWLPTQAASFEINGAVYICIRAICEEDDCEEVAFFISEAKGV